MTLKDACALPGLDIVGGVTVAWILLEGAWHRVSSHEEQTACNLALGAGSVLVGAPEVLDDIRQNRTTICGPCDRHAYEATGDVSADHPELTERQREVSEFRSERRREEQKRRKLRAAIARDKDSDPKSESVRTVSGGLPGLGRRG